MSKHIAAREFSSEELVRAHIRQIEEVNPELNAVVLPLFDSAMEAARAADARLARGELDGPLHGVPISIKDSIDVRGARTTAGTIGRRSAQPATEDAVLVARLREAGAIPIAKTNLPDLLFAYESDNSLFGRTNNPYDLTRTAGGSSGGEAALIAACGSPLGLGSDAAGSVRVPAAFCGIASIKPTIGRLPRTGHVPGPGGWVESLWQIGPMARWVEDLETCMPLLAGEDGIDFACPPVPLDSSDGIRGLRVARLVENGFARTSDAVRATVYEATRALETAGAQIDDSAPPGIACAYDLELSLLGADGCAGLDAYAREQGSHALHPLTERGFLSRMRPRAMDAAALGILWARWDEYRRAMAEFFSKFDVLLCPVYSSTALLHGTSVDEENFRGFSHTMAWNVAGNPAATVRCGETDGLPVNVQIVTKRWRDRLALQVARFLEERLGGWQPSPSHTVRSSDHSLGTKAKETGDGASY